MTKETCLDCGFDGLALQTRADALLARVDSLTKFVEQAEAERDALRAELASIQRLPELPWAEVSASIAQRLAALARAGFQSDARALLAVLDKGKTFVTRIEAERDAALADAARLRTALADALTLERLSQPAYGEVADRVRAALTAADSQLWLDEKLAEARSDGWERAVLAWSEAFARRGTAFRSDLEPSATLADHDARVAGEARKAALEPIEAAAVALMAERDEETTGDPLLDDLLNAVLAAATAAGLHRPIVRALAAKEPKP